LEMPNWLEISIRPRYAQFFIDTNNFLLDDLRADVFAQWKTIARARKEFK